MWLDKNDRAHTESIPDPESYFDHRFLRFVKKNYRCIDDSFIDSFQDEIIEKCLKDPEYSRIKSSDLKERELPDDISIGADISSFKRGVHPIVRKAVNDLPLEWRLDATWCISDVVDECD